ncbi:MAG: type IV pilus assembly protein PilY1 [Zhongshania aliphaticivorans]|jgi:type IV pilus assembly protein PilY1|uniref:pilus assembly protein n=1 Tax=Zhongshania aliphaticivorans TaxID=1470434 RepID=UPI0039E6250A
MIAKAGLRCLLLIIGPILLTAISPKSLAALNIANTPLSFATGVSPNIIMAIDDSGSMDAELLMPTNDGALWWHTGSKSFVGRDKDDVITAGVLNFNKVGGANGTWKKYTYLFPNGTGSGNRVYGDSDNDHYAVPPTAQFAFARSPDYNKAYFNPEDIYVPWPSAGSATFSNIIATSAPSDPTQGSSSFDLTQNINNSNNNHKFRFQPGMRLPNGDTATSTTNEALSYYPATFYLTEPLPSRFAYTSAPLSGYAPDGTTVLYGYEIKSANFSSTANYNAMMQNFANWFSYYRKRHLATRAGVALSFFDVNNARVGEFTINNRNNVSMNALADSSDRISFYDTIYSRGGNGGGTPNREALNHAGQQFQRSNNGAPITHACQANAAILFTDGYSNVSSISGVGNEDGGKGAPYQDSASSTMADIAMKYYDNHLRSDLATGQVPVAAACNRQSRPPALDCKTNLHMLTYAVTLGTGGILYDPDNPADPYANPPNWHTTFENRSPTAIDDLWHATINGRGALLIASKPVEIATKLKSAITRILQSIGSSSAIASNSTRLDSDTLIFQARYDSRDWSGQILAYEVASDGALADIKWDSNTSNGIASHANRNILTWSDSAVNFTWENLATAEKSALTADLTSANAAIEGPRRVNWLRGDRSLEGTNPDYRIRSHLLGDIVHSNPYFHWDQNYGFSRLSGVEGSSYAAYLSAKKAKPAMLFVGANDGMLHGFNANTGTEEFAYIPKRAYSALYTLTKPDYEHKYFVDGSPLVIDAYWDGAWRSVLVGASGAGGGSVFAIDVSDPANIDTTDILWDFHTAAAATNKLGLSMSNPVLTRLATGDWVAIFGNGYNSGDTVKLFVVNLKTGALIKAIDTKVAGIDNGLGDILAVDTDGDRITDYVYAGDLSGNVWKFDLSATNSSQWDSAFKTGSNPVPLFVAKDVDGNRQAITAAMTSGRHPDGGIMIYFGTGKYFEQGDSVVSNSPQLQSFYGIRDNGSRISARSDLQLQSIIYEATPTLRGGTAEFPVRVVSDTPVSYSAKKGWVLDLKNPNATNGAGERVTDQAILRNGRVIFNTLIPSADPCNFGGTSHLMEIDTITGGRLVNTVLDINGDGLINDDDMVNINGDFFPPSGKKFDQLITRPGIIGAGEKEYKYTSGSRGSIGLTLERGTGKELGRQSWWQLR